jgi:hypothetical protein
VDSPLSSSLWSSLDLFRRLLIVLPGILKHRTKSPFQKIASISARISSCDIWVFRPRVVYANRQRMRGKHGRELLRKRGELLERGFAHMYDTGGMRRLCLRGRENILKRLLVHAAGFNLSLVMRKRFGAGTPRQAAGLVCSLQALLTITLALLSTVFAVCRKASPIASQRGARFEWECC